MSKSLPVLGSAGSEPADRINPAAIEAMREAGIDITAGQPKILTVGAVRDSDVVTELLGSR